MSYINENFLNLQQSYLFANIAKKVAKYSEEHPDKKIIKLGIGDVTRPIVPACVEAMHKAVDEIGTQEGFKGYGPEQGYEFLRKAIVEKDYKKRGVDLELDEKEVDNYLANLEDILNFANIVNNAPVEGLDITIGANEAKNVFRKDEVKVFKDNKSLLQNAPDQAQNMFKIPKVIE